MASCRSDDSGLNSLSLGPSRLMGLFRGGIRAYIQLSHNAFGAWRGIKGKGFTPWLERTIQTCHEFLT